jgi:hypothetical protein
MILPAEDKVKIPAPTAQQPTAAAQQTQAAEQQAPTQTVETPRTEQPKATNYERTMQALRQAQYQTPNFESSYDEQISSLYDQIINRKPFSYDAASDPLYQQYREQYMQTGQQAMRDTMGQAAALTGGYGSTYGESVGQQQYNAYLSRLNEVLPELYGQAYSRWADEGNRLTTDLSLASALRSADYDQFRDQLTDERYAFAQAVTEAEQKAQHGDFSGYADLYGEDEARRMMSTWAAANPLAAYTNGNITGEEFYNLTGQYPIGFMPAGAAVGGGGKAASDALREQATQHRDRLIREGYDPAQVMAAWEEDMRDYNRF